MQWCRAGVAPVLSAVFVMAMAEPCAADVVTNRWIGAEGAAWGTGSNWSENHVPNGDEYVIFPDRDGSYSINVDGDYEVGCFYVDYRKLANGDYDVNGNLTSRVDFTLTGAAGRKLHFQFPTGRFNYLATLGPAISRGTKARESRSRSGRRSVRAGSR